VISRDRTLMIYQLTLIPQHTNHSKTGISTRRSTYDLSLLCRRFADKLFHRPLLKSSILTSTTPNYTLVSDFVTTWSPFEWRSVSGRVTGRRNQGAHARCSLCSGYTISEAILADAAALTRGDRFLSVNFTRTPNILPRYLIVYIMLCSSIRPYIVGLPGLSIRQK
jgi:hypothetical protein